MGKKIKILGIHGLGDHRNSTWKEDWEKTLLQVWPGRSNIELECAFLTYDPIFENVDISPWETSKAIWKLTKSGISSLFRRRKGIIDDISDRIRWTAGYVVAWVEDEDFQQETRKLVLDSIRDEKPDFILAHSLGSLITYNAFTHTDAKKADIARILKKARYVTLGAQIGNPFVIRNLTPGRIQPIDVKYWYHLYNDEDDVFTAPIRLPDAINFMQVDTHFDIDGFADHAATEYLGHVNTIENVWRFETEGMLDSRAFGVKKISRSRTIKKKDRPNKRALLIGINDYPNEADRLEGCVNDVFLMSSVLQECGFPPESIRVCLDKRATARGIFDRLEWLLDDPKPGDERIFYYSGHGATIPEYGEYNEPDRLTETLVPWDFDWSEETAIIDDQIFYLYSQLPWDIRLAMIFDCCHSGGIHRNGGMKARGLNPPDDIRHRQLRWDLKTNMWVPRDFIRINEKFSSDKSTAKRFFGENGQTSRLGRSSILRGTPETEYKKLKQKDSTGKIGPYLPLIIEACDENQLSYEYRHGVTSYGAFTYSLCSILRKRKRISYNKLVEETGAQLADLGYDQMPQILGPEAVTHSIVPWRTGTKTVSKNK
ncbi:MAG: caspase family protein [Desulfobacteraceae bacterium]|jgi:hypothetical protein